MSRKSLGGPSRSTKLDLAVAAVAVGAAAVGIAAGNGPRDASMCQGILAPSSVQASLTF